MAILFVCSQMSSEVHTISTKCISFSLLGVFVYRKTIVESRHFTDVGC
jgi:hypothetical protein